MSGFSDLPSLPSYILKPLPPLIAPIPDKLLTLLLPIAAYWALSMFFHWIDTRDYFPQYRLHTPAEVTKRNRVSRWEVVRDVVIQQIVQTAVGWVLGMTEPDDFYGKEQYDIAVWARRIRIVERLSPGLLAVCGIDAGALGDKLGANYPSVAGAVTGGNYPALQYTSQVLAGSTKPLPGFAAWELSLAWLLYWVVVPLIQFGVAILVVDTWQYFLHRAMHMNKWLYSTCRCYADPDLALTYSVATFHSRHHRLYVPYAYGALYNHPFEGFLLDTLGTSIAYKAAFLNTRQGMCLFTGATFKTVDDHCGYALPWDPLQHITSNNAGYHDVHHQSWGIKTNFSQPFFTFWDRLLGTVWTGGDVSARYERSRLAAQKALDLDDNTLITGPRAESSATAKLEPYQNDLQNTKDLHSVPVKHLQPEAPAGKAQLQAAGSRQQILDDKKDGGVSVLADEALEEKGARAAVRRRPRKSTTSSLPTRDSFKGLRERVTGSMHGRTGGIIGVDGS